MPRNLDRRVELMFPVDSPEIWQRVMDVLQVELDDTEKARLMQPDGSYSRVDRRGKQRLDSQQELCRRSMAAASEKPETVDFLLVKSEK